MKILVVYYSRTGTTKKLGDAIASKLSCDTEEIFDTADWSGPLGYIKAGRSAMKNKLSTLKVLDKDIAGYDLVVVGTPVWAWNVLVPVRTFLSQNRDKLNKVAFFLTMGGKQGKTFESMT